MNATLSIYELHLIGGQTKAENQAFWDLIQWYSYEKSQFFQHLDLYPDFIVGLLLKFLDLIQI